MTDAVLRAGGRPLSFVKPLALRFYVWVKDLVDVKFTIAEDLMDTKVSILEDGSQEAVYYACDGTTYGVQWYDVFCRLVTIVIALRMLLWILRRYCPLRIDKEGLKRKGIQMIADIADVDIVFAEASGLAPLLSVESDPAPIDVAPTTSCRFVPFNPSMIFEMHPTMHVTVAKDTPSCSLLWVTFEIRFI